VIFPFTFRFMYQFARVLQFHNEGTTGYFLVCFVFFYVYTFILENLFLPSLCPCTLQKYVFLILFFRIREISYVCLLCNRREFISIAVLCNSFIAYLTKLIQLRRLCIS
jgi:hypothetical protein